MRAVLVADGPWQAQVLHRAGAAAGRDRAGAHAVPEVPAVGAGQLRGLVQVRGGGAQPGRARPRARHL